MFVLCYLIYLLKFSMTTLLDYRTTLAYLAYLGYDGDATNALKITRPKRLDRRRGKIQRTVFLSYVFGATGSGKVRSRLSALKDSLSLSEMPLLDGSFTSVCKIALFRELL
jgi:Ras family protein T1